MILVCLAGIQSIKPDLSHAVHGTNETKREELLAKIKEAEAE